MKVHTLADQFAQALANGELKVSDIQYVLEHVDGYLMDYQPETYKWMPQQFEDVAAELAKAHDIATGDDEEDSGADAKYQQMKDDALTGDDE